jgi:hypothetical protein
MKQNKKTRAEWPSKKSFWQAPIEEMHIGMVLQTAMLLLWKISKVKITCSETRREA